jgi:hypothetical protein
LEGFGHILMEIFFAVPQNSQKTVHGNVTEQRTEQPGGSGVGKVGWCVGCFLRKVSGLVRSSVGLKKKRHFKKEKRIFGWREQRWGHTAKARDLPHFSATSVGGRTQSTAKEKGKDTKRGQTQTQVVL